jgi:hypothetical protein
MNEEKCMRLKEIYCVMHEINPIRSPAAPLPVTEVLNIIQLALPYQI